MLSGPRKPRRSAIFISGGGSTLQSLLEMQHLIDVNIIVTNSRKAYGILKARRFGKNVLFFGAPFDYLELHKLLKVHKIESIVLAGFMKILPEVFVDLWKNRILNIHPSLLPQYPGLKSAERSYADKVSMGVTIHVVTPVMDGGAKLLATKSLNIPGEVEFEEANLFLRRSEQHLLREMVLRYF